ncbi:ABC transporter permease subunit [Bacillus sp. P14.5]|uniref:ABC transporter permease subunit n=1 Tax=Bacillus sp. P14.5 TaxID=1983400 RepID=UPI000DEB8CB8|nr:ABC transporter permease subunit [Bacillus sp. P14.5]
MKTIKSGFIYTVLVFFGFFLISSVSSILKYDHELVIHLDNYLLTLKTTLQQMFDITSLQLKWEDSGKYYPIKDVFADSYFYSFFILLLAFILSITVSIVLTYMIMVLPKKINRFVTRILDLLDALPDVFIVVLLQLLIIWLYKKTGYLLFDIYTLGEDRIYFLPVVCLAILPITYLMKNFIFQLKEEEVKPYIEFSYSKGFSKFYTLWVHLFRNVWIHFFYHSKPVFLLMLSNLLIIELLFNINGFMKALLLASTTSPPAFLIGMLMIVLPFFLLYTLGSLFLKFWLKEGTTIE